MTLFKKILPFSWLLKCHLDYPNVTCNSKRYFRNPLGQHTLLVITLSTKVEKVSCVQIEDLHKNLDLTTPSPPNILIPFSSIRLDFVVVCTFTMFHLFNTNDFEKSLYNDKHLLSLEVSTVNSISILPFFAVPEWLNR